MADQKSTSALAIFLFVILSRFLISTANLSPLKLDFQLDLYEVGSTNCKIIRSSDELYHIFGKEKVDDDQQRDEHQDYMNGLHHRFSQFELKVFKFGTSITVPDSFNCWKQAKDHRFSVINSSSLRPSDSVLNAELVAMSKQFVDPTITILSSIWSSKFDPGSVLSIHAGNFSENSPLSLRYVLICKLLRIELVKTQSIRLIHPHLDPESMTNLKSMFEFMITTGNRKRREVVQLIDMENECFVFDKLFLKAFKHIYSFLHQDHRTPQHKIQFVVLPKQVLSKRVSLFDDLQTKVHQWCWRLFRSSPDSSSLPLPAAIIFYQNTIMFDGVTTTSIVIKSVVVNSSESWKKMLHVVADHMYPRALKVMVNMRECNRARFKAFYFAHQLFDDLLHRASALRFIRHIMSGDDFQMQSLIMKSVNLENLFLKFMNLFLKFLPLLPFLCQFPLKVYVSYYFSQKIVLKM